MGKENSIRSGGMKSLLFKSRASRSPEQPPSRLPQPSPSAGGKPQPQQQEPQQSQAAAMLWGAAAGASYVRARPKSSGTSTPRSFSQPPNSARGLPPPPGLVRRQTPNRDGSQSARQRESALPSLGSSTYRDALVTRHSTLPGPPPPLPPTAPRRTSNLAPLPPTGSRDNDGTARSGAAQQQPLRAPQQEQLATLQEKRLGVMQQQARASHEQKQMEQHIRRLEASMAVQHQELCAALVVVAALEERRGTLADHAARLQQLCSQSQRAANGRRSELQHLELLAQSVQASLERQRLQEAELALCSTSARNALLHIMQAAATALKLPGLASGIQQELQRPGDASGTAPGAGIAAAGPVLLATVPVVLQQAQQAPAQGQQQQVDRTGAPPPSPSASEEGYATPPGSITGCGNSSSESGRGSDSEGSSTASSPRDAPSIGGAGEITARPTVSAATAKLLPLSLCLAGLPAMEASTVPCGRTAHKLPSARRLSSIALPPLPLEPAALAPAAPGVCPLSPEVLARLQSIQARLDTALADQAVTLPAMSSPTLNI